jgi:hypothetical protein
MSSKTTAIHRDLIPSASTTRGTTLNSSSSAEAALRRIVAKNLDNDRRLDLTTTTTDTLLPGAACFLLEVADSYYSDYVGFARWYYRRRRQFPLYQPPDLGRKGGGGNPARASPSGVTAVASRQLIEYLI